MSDTLEDSVRDGTLKPQAVHLSLVGYSQGRKGTCDKAISVWVKRHRIDGTKVAFDQTKLLHVDL